MSVSKYQIIQEVRELIPLAARQLQMMLEDYVAIPDCGRTAGAG